MNRTSFVAGVVLGLLLAGGTGAAYVNGYGPAPGTPGGGDSIDRFPTETTQPGGTGGGDSTTATGPEFGVTVDSVETCGRTCRDVTTTLSNAGGEATNVTVYSRVFVGKGTDGEVVWSGKERVGVLASGESYTSTRRVSLSYAEAYDVRDAGGWVTIQTTIVSDDRTVTFSEQRNVG